MKTIRVFPTRIALILLVCIAVIAVFIYRGNTLFHENTPATLPTYFDQYNHYDSEGLWGLESLEVLSVPEDLNSSLSFQSQPNVTLTISFHDDETIASILVEAPRDLFLERSDIQHSFVAALYGLDPETKILPDADDLQQRASRQNQYGDTGATWGYLSFAFITDEDTVAMRIHTHTSFTTG